jgi:hypothetical protein
MRSLVVASAMVLAFVAACAKGGMSDDDDGDDVSPIDAPEQDVDSPPQVTADANVSLPDGSGPADAFVPPPPDAFVPPPPDAFVPPPDASPMNPPFCDANADCVEPGTCCFLVACVPGTPIGAQCFPS